MPDRPSLTSIAEQRAALHPTGADPSADPPAAPPGDQAYVVGRAVPVIDLREADPGDLIGADGLPHPSVSSSPVVTATRDGAGILTAVTGPNGTYDTFARDGLGRITSFEFNGTVYTVARNAAGQITGVS